MIVAAVLFAYAALLSTLAPRLLRGAHWAERAPRLGIVVWQALGASALTAAVLAGLALTVPTVRVSADLAELLQACVMALTEQYASPGGAAAGAAGAVLALAVLGRTLWCAGQAIVRIRRERREHREVLDMVGRPDTARGVVVLDHDEPAAYCLPGRHRRTVITTGALRALDDDQLEAVLAHERAHQAERHDAVLAWAQVLTNAFPRIPLFRIAEAEIARLVEMRADDVAAARSGRLTTAAALLAVAGGRAPAVALSASGSTAARRVRRLIEPHRPLSRTRIVAGSLTAAVALAVPLLVVGGPAAAATQVNYCPDGTPAAQVTTMR
ncbi:M56 family metallopeptidase [Streptomyces sp. ME08-AFT2]|uniref:M56 family metallopeptidase n=1 Tax=Streptomyces sp. ME08-AFT2 TaxID=3028683 RepID=UPI0029AA48A9|nr:M56 family metallopeptidase [Streptomyces sp. ME08-AFT2]MDX3308204.1 M56 family metallopeptidase [Streptomyces sp. ME08-AFT2]